jgi:hypothetical protein
MRKGKKLADYLDKKTRELNITDYELSKLIKPGTSGSFIARIRLGRVTINERNSTLIAKFFKKDPCEIMFMSGRMPKEIEEMILKDEILQKNLIGELKRWKKVEEKAK